MNRRQEILSAFRVEPCPPVVDWLEGNIYLPRKFAPRGFGRFSTRDRPFQRPLLECFHPGSGVTDCVVSGGTQLTKTAVLLLGAAYRMRFEPLPAILVVPSIDFAKKKIVQRRLHPLINENPVLAELKPDNPDEFTLTEMNMRGGEFTLSGAGSATNLSSITAGLIYQDECAKLKRIGAEDGEEEAHPMDLADERGKDFQDLAFRYKSSSPNSENHPFWAAFERGSQTQFAVPCPNCGGFFPFEFIRETSGETDSKTDYRSVIWSPDARDRDGLWDEDKVRKSARYVCKFCGYHIKSEEKAGMISRFELFDGNAAASPAYRSFLCPSFLAPSISFGEMAWQFLKNLEKFDLRNFYNSWLALPFSEIAEKLTDETIRGLINPEYKRGTIPRTPQAVGVYADPGETTGCHWLAAARMDDGDIYVIDWGNVLGPHDLNGHPRKNGYALAGTSKRLAAGGGMIDSRWNTEAVYEICFRSGGFWRPTRGSEASAGHWVSNPIQSHPGLRLIQFVDQVLKSELYGRRIANGGPPRIHLPADADATLIKQLSGQQQDRRTGKWKRLPNDHFGDCLKQAVLDQWVARAVGDTVRKAISGGN